MTITAKSSCVISADRNNEKTLFLQFIFSTGESSNYFQILQKIFINVFHFLPHIIHYNFSKELSSSLTFAEALGTTNRPTTPVCLSQKSEKMRRPVMVHGILLVETHLLARTSPRGEVEWIRFHQSAGHVKLFI